MLRRVEPDRAVGDVIPFWDAATGRYHLFFLSTAPEASDTDRLRGVTWEHVSSANLRDWDVHPSAIRPSDIDRDGAYTGSVVQHRGRFHLFYTAVLDDRPTPQMICHLVSDDLMTWDRADDDLLGPPAGFEQSDWRDPFVFWNPGERQFWMLVTAREVQGAGARRGCLVVATSHDLHTWTVRPRPLAAPISALVPECAEMFPVGDRWLLAYSTFTEHSGAHFCLGEGPQGEWADAVDFADAARWYAAKSLREPGGRLLSFGWIPDRAGGDNRGTLLWGGDLAVPRETWIDERGRVCQRLPIEVVEQFDAPSAVTVTPEHGCWRRTAADAVESDRSGYATAVVEMAGEGAALLSCTIRWLSGGGVAGLVFGGDPDAESGMQLSIDPLRECVRLHELSAAHTHMVTTPPGDWVVHPYAAGEEVTVQAIVEGSCLEVFVDGRLALTHRYVPRGGEWSVRLVAENAHVEFCTLSSRRESDL